MPEGHTLHRLALDHRRDFAGHTVSVSSPQGRFATEARRLDERVVEDVEAYGKHLFYDFGSGDLVHVHLGLFGRFFRWEPSQGGGPRTPTPSQGGGPRTPTPSQGGGPRTPTPSPPQPRDTVRLRLSSVTATVDLVGATECALIDPDVRAAIVSRLGPDPLRNDADPDLAWKKLQRRKTPIGAALMDQSVLAGVGNVYRAEILHKHGIHPEQPSNTITREQWQSMWTTLVKWMRHGVKDNVIITVDPKVVGKRRSRIRKGEALYVYKQDRCFTCGGEIRRWDLNGRWAYACERCQPLVTQRPR